ETSPYFRHFRFRLLQAASRVLPVPAQRAGVRLGGPRHSSQRRLFVDVRKERREIRRVRRHVGLERWTSIASARPDQGERTRALSNPLMDIFVLGVALLLPWAVGAVWLHALQSGSPRTPLLQPIAYGHLGGILVLTLLMRAMSAIGVRWSFMTLSLILVALLVAGIAIGSRLGHKLKSGDPRPVAHIDPFPWRWLGIMAAILLVFRMGDLAYEVLLQPIYPWDAWTQWATKAKVWSALHTMAPFIDYSQWLARQPGYVDTASHYPATVPLMQAWMSLALGRFDDALINLPWLTLCVALAAGIYAQARALRVAASWAMFITYAALSLPMLDTHVALAGYADLYVGAVFALAVMSLLRWERSREGI